MCIDEEIYKKLRQREWQREREGGKKKLVGVD